MCLRPCLRAFRFRCRNLWELDMNGMVTLGITTTESPRPYPGAPSNVKFGLAA